MITIVFGPIKKKIKTKENTKPFSYRKTVSIPSFNIYLAKIDAGIILFQKGRVKEAIRCFNSAKGLIARLRKLSLTTATKYFKANKIEINKENKTFLINGNEIIIEFKVWFANKRSKDVHNLFYKPILDGFTDAGIYHDDNDVKSVKIELMGYDKENPRIEVLIYEKEK